LTLRSIWKKFKQPTRWECRCCVWALDCLRGYQWWSLQASALTLYITKSASLSQHQKNWLFSEPHTYYQRKINVR